MTISRAFAATSLIFAITAGAAQAQPPGPPPGPRGIVAEPCPGPLARPPELAQVIANPNMPPPPSVVAFNQEQDRRNRVDWANLCRYVPDNAARKAAAPPTAVFIGDSITEGWARSGADFFTANGVVGRGISGQVSGQNLLQFQQDVVNLKPKVVHIMIGTNDVAGNAGPTSYGDIVRNLQAMVDLARANKIKVVLATIPPAADFPWRRGLEPAPHIIRLNGWIRDYAKRENIVVADYHAALANPQGGFRAEWSGDGVHPNAAGFKVMEPIASAAIKQALAKPR